MKDPIASLFTPHSTRQYDTKVAFYVPTVSAGETTASKEQLTIAVRNFLVLRLGGCTEITAQGYYADEKQKKVIKERVTYFYAYSSWDKIQENAGAITQLANALCIEFNQSEVAIEIDGNMFSYSPTAKYRAEYEKRRNAAIKQKQLSFFMEQVQALNLDGDA